MFDWKILTPIFLGVLLWAYSARASKKHAKALDDPFSPESIAAKELLLSLPAELRSILVTNIQQGQTLNAVKILRAHHRKLGLQPASDAIHFLKKEVPAA